MVMREKLRDIITIMKYNLKIEMRYPVSYLAAVLNTVFWMLAFVTFILLFVGGESDSIVPNLIAWGLATYVLFNGFITEVGFGIVRLQRRGTLEQILLTPISIMSLPLGLAGYQIVISLFFIGLIVILVIWLSGSSFLIANPLEGIIALALILIMFYGFSLLLAALSIKLKRSSWALVNAMTMSYMIFCGAFYAFSMMPPQMLVISMMIPFSYAVDLFRTRIVGIEPELIKQSVLIWGIELSPITIEWLIVAILSVSMLVLGVGYLKRTIDNARKEGTLGTY